MSLPTLPDEITGQILSHLEWPDIKNIRTLHRKLADVGLEYFPRNVTLVATKWSLDRVNSLLSLETVRKNVKSLTICCYLYLPKDQGPTFIPNPELRKTAKKAFSRHCKMIHHGSYLASLKEILQKLPSLESVAISDYPRSSEILPRSQNSKQVSKDRYLSGAGAPEGKTDLVKQVLDAVLIKLGDHSPANQQPSISLEYSYGPYGLEKVSDRELSPLGLETIKQLKLGMAYETHEQTGNWRTHEGYFRDAGSFAARASNLESLELALNSPWGSFKEFCQLRQFRPYLRLPKLKHLGLDGMLFDKCDVFPFFENHKATLESLSFKACMIMNNHSRTSWFDFFKDVEGTLSLQSLELHTILSHDPEPCDDWPTRYPETIPPERAVRYLASRQKTKMRGKEDAVSQHPYDWESLTWSSVKSDYTRLSRRISRKSPLLPVWWRDTAFAPEKWIPIWQDGLSDQEDDSDGDETESALRGNRAGQLFGSMQGGSGIIIQGNGIRNVRTRQVPFYGGNITEYMLDLRPRRGP
ncbi:hypothetical protein MMC10_002635 [Thelotrema lepadinum]|nr:hypothetical protein [Thelotrema lepadinum]